MLNVLVTMQFSETQIARLRTVSPQMAVTRAEPGRADYSRADVLYASAPPRELARVPGLKWLQLPMAGINAIHDHPLYTKTEVPLTTTSGVHAATVAEYAVTTLLALAHRVPRMVEWKNKGRWPPDEQRWPLFVPTEVRGATLGIIGYGSIGRELARIAKTAFAMTVLACKRDPSQRTDPGYCVPGTGDPEGVLPDEWLSPAELPSLLARSDVVVMAAPLIPATQRMLGADAFRAMKRSAYFINVGRGATVDEAALAQALREGQIAGAAVDVFAEEPPPKRHPLYGVDHVIISPHVSGFVASYDDRCADLFAENLRRYLAGPPLLNLVDRAKGY
ncbi:MAG TPA: D-2-hydroxyacid dehydrogenase [Candidatus Limnocylindrales bacterium]|nr:D-2-hydroxyacid dehydrogenase [Candidatus Limnocylindrales bacterium]